MMHTYGCLGNTHYTILTTVGSAISAFFGVSCRKIQEQQSAKRETEPILARELRSSRSDAAQRVWEPPATDLADLATKNGPNVGGMRWDMLRLILRDFKPFLWEKT